MKSVFGSCDILIYEGSHKNLIGYFKLIVDYQHTLTTVHACLETRVVPQVSLKNKKLICWKISQYREYLTSVYPVFLINNICPLPILFPISYPIDGVANEQFLLVILLLFTSYWVHVNPHRAKDQTHFTVEIPVSFCFD